MFLPHKQELSIPSEVQVLTFIVEKVDIGLAAFM